MFGGNNKSLVRKSRGKCFVKMARGALDVHVAKMPRDPMLTPNQSLIKLVQRDLAGGPVNFPAASSHHIMNGVWTTPTHRVESKLPVEWPRSWSPVIHAKLCA